MAIKKYSFLIPTSDLTDEIKAIIAQVCAKLHRICYRKDPIMRSGPWVDGNIKFLSTGGWEFVVFNDAGEFDYFDHIRLPNGNIFDFDCISGTEIDEWCSRIDYEFRDVWGLD